MADNTAIKNATGGTETIADDEITGGVADGAKVQRVKVGFGSDGSYQDVDTSAALPVAAAVYIGQVAITAATDESIPALGPIDAFGYAEGVLRVNASDDFAGGPVTLSVGARSDADPVDSYTSIWLDLTGNPSDSPSTDTIVSVNGSGVQEVSFPVRAHHLGVLASGVASITAGSINVELVLRPVPHIAPYAHVTVDNPVTIGGFVGAVPVTPYTAFASGDLAGIGQTVNFTDGLARTVRVDVTGTFVGTVGFTSPLMDLATGSWVASTTVPGSYIGVRNTPSGESFVVTMSAYASGTASVVINGWSGPARVELTAPFVNGAPVANDNPLPVIAATPATSTCTSVAGATGDTSLLAANASRTWFAVFNDSTAVLYLKCGTGASSTSYTVQVASNGYFELGGYAGAVNGAWATATGNARCTEVSG